MAVPQLPTIPKSFRLPSAIRNRRNRVPSTTVATAVGLQNAAPLASQQTPPSPGNRRGLWLPLPTPSQAHTILRTGPRLLFRTGPRLLLRAPVAVLRAPGTVRNFSKSRLRLRDQRKLFGDALEAEKVAKARGEVYGKEFEGKNEGDFMESQLGGEKAEQEAGPSTSQTKESFTTRLKQRLSDSPTKWYPIPLSVGVAVLVVVNFYKQRSWEQEEGDKKGKRVASENEVKVQGPWQVHVLGALPLRSISRLYGYLNSYTLPVWFRVPGYKLYAYVFGANLNECDPEDLREYRSMSEFFMRRLKEGVRPIAETVLVSPADGKIVNFGTVTNGRVEQVKGSTYSLSALLDGTGQTRTPEPTPPSKGYHYHPQKTEYKKVDEKEFAKINDIEYSLEELLGSGKKDGESTKVGESTSSPEPSVKDASLSHSHSHETSQTGGEEGTSSKSQLHGPTRTLASDASVAMEVGSGAQRVGMQPKEGNKLFFAVVYLAPGDYHRFHSPTSWVVERRRHFAGELFSVSPWMANKLQDLFVLNERVALLGRWRHGFFSMVPVGATNVGSIQVNFDSSLRTNSPLRPITPGTYSEATYAKASSLLKGQPLQKGDEVGGFWLGSTIVLVFEAPEKFEFKCELGKKVKMGEALGEVAK